MARLKKLIIIYVLFCLVVVALPTVMVMMNQTAGMGSLLFAKQEGQQYAALSSSDKRQTAPEAAQQQATVSDIEPSKLDVGQEMDSYQGIPVYFNGVDYAKSYGKSYSKDGYYFGLKWQCVEFVKRFYYEIKGHKMPNSFGNAKDFFDPDVPQGGLNSDRGLMQYKNGKNVKPQPDDILVFTNGQYGHVAIVTKVGTNSLEIIQQNESTSRAVFPLSVVNGRYFVGSSSTKIPAGWLRQAR